ncbi:MAG TPA: barstar family protein, partial [Thermoanaerobaculia bacterium]|nr:barstar family protein [Thermoanaerobaculia bacterium]
MSLAEAVRFVARAEHTVAAYELKERVASDAELFRALAAAMEFDEHFGANWDALIDSLRDVPPKQKGTVALIVHNAEELWRIA